MDQNEFKAKLKELFWKYEKRQLKKLDKIVEEFQGEEEAVLKHLNKRYRIHTPAVSTAPETPKVEEAEEEVAQIDEGADENEEAAVNEDGGSEEERDSSNEDDEEKEG